MEDSSQAILNSRHFQRASPLIVDRIVDRSHLLKVQTCEWRQGWSGILWALKRAPDQRAAFLAQKTFRYLDGMRHNCVLMIRCVNRDVNKSFQFNLAHMCDMTQLLNNASLGESASYCLQRWGKNPLGTLLEVQREQLSRAFRTFRCSFRRWSFW